MNPPHSAQASSGSQQQRSRDHGDRMELARASLVAVLASCVTIGTASAHGGQYRGPSTVVPPASGSTNSAGSASGGGAGSSATTSQPGPSASNSSSGPAGPVGAAGAGKVGGRGYAVDADLSSWEFWWEFQKDPLLRARDGLDLRRAIHATDALLGGRAALGSTLEAPTEREVRTVVIPALVAALRNAADRDTTTAAMIALAKIGQDPDGLRLHDLFRERLTSLDQEIRETAALALGIARQCRREDIDLLVALATDSPAGQRATARSEVDQRTRAFACYGLGLCLPNMEPVRRNTPVRALLSLLKAEGAASVHRNVTVAAIAALGQLPSEAEPASGALVDLAASGLLAFYDLDLGPGAQLVQSHCPMSLSALLGRSHPLSAECRTRFVARLASEAAADLGPGSKSNDHVAQSCAAALGALCRPWENEDSPDRAACETLIRVYRTARDHQTRYFAALAVGRIGGSKARGALLAELRGASRAIEQPWIMLSLGSLAADHIEAQKREGQTPEPDLEIRDALIAALGASKNPQTIGAASIAVGLCRAPGSADRLRSALSTYGHREDVGGQIAIGLSLLDERGAAPQLRELLAGSVRQPQLLVRLATALGKLGDADAVTQLVAMLETSEGGLARMSALSSGLGQLGDRRCIAPLVQMLQNPQLTPLTRAFAAVALGGVCDPEPMPWNARYAAAVNYRAAVETLTDGATGILDIL